ncbi:MAG: glycosyltransferase [Saprospiraceae bacterium]
MIILYTVCIIGLLHTYIIYPIILRWMAAPKKNNKNCHSESDSQLPTVSILMAAYNEEMVIKKKIESILATNYPFERLNIFIGSDNSNDNTNEIVEEIASKHSSLFFKNFTKRQGKPSIINQLSEWANEANPVDANHIYIITDANVLFSKELIFELVKHFKNKELALVDSNIMNLGMKKEGISYTESFYIKGEVQLKHLEGVIWQQTLGPLGGCFALRSTYYSDVPSKYLVDDFYIAMRAFEQGGKAINEPKAVCYEDVSHSIKEEFRRKTRIATGNFQNLKRFKKLWLIFPPNSLSFIFVSHKVLRWFGPFLIIGTWLSSGTLAYLGNLLFQLLFILESAFLLAVPLLYFAMQSLGIQSSIIRTITYFNAANLAMLRGLFKYLKGVKTNVWQPTKRHTTEIRHD